LCLCLRLLSLYLLALGLLLLLDLGIVAILHAGEIVCELNEGEFSDVPLRIGREARWVLTGVEAHCVPVHKH
jgi:hypothetical protein